MKLFRCDHCRSLVYFENHRCLRCGHALAFLPDARIVASLDPAGPPAAGDVWTTPAASARGQLYRLCANYTQHQVCNWAVPATSPHTLCPACRLTRVIPDLSVPGHREHWYLLETAKRRLLHDLARLGLPIVAKADDPGCGLAFEFLADPPPGAPASTPVKTGHADGVITLALAEADDAERERRRATLHEPLRTLLGHFRHEVGHYYWDRLIRDGGRLEEFRTVFGDERADYGGALAWHYQQGAPADWQDHHVSAYASAHPWEDWAETWAHYLHLSDALETAAECGLHVPPVPGVPTLAAATGGGDRFAEMLDSWHALTHVLNNLNRSLGLRDAYPFALSPVAAEKMRFVHDIIVGAAT